MAAPVIISGFVLAGVFILIVTFIQFNWPSFHEYLNELVLYGKLSKSKNAVRTSTLYKFPKRYFSHFYMAGLMVNFLLLLITVLVYRGHVTLPSMITDTLNWLFQPHQEPSIDAFSTVLTLCVLTGHVTRRLGETWYVHVFSDGSVNGLQYLVGVAFYPAVTASVLAESPSWSDGPRGAVENHRYRLPRGFLFRYLSSPHYLMEILIYTAFCALQNFQNLTFYSVIFFVVVNQTMYALLAHDWYRTKFDDYPKNRRAVIPFIL